MAERDAEARKAGRDNTSVESMISDRMAWTAENIRVYTALLLMEQWEADGQHPEEIRKMQESVIPEEFHKTSAADFRAVWLRCCTYEDVIGWTALAKMMADTRRDLLKGETIDAWNVATIQLSYTNVLNNKVASQAARATRTTGGGNDPYKPRGNRQNAGTCKFWNSEANSCKFNDACYHRHVCAKCGSKTHGKQQCTKVAAAAGGGKK
jgi:hypothetical protein